MTRPTSLVISRLDSPFFPPKFGYVLQVSILKTPEFTRVAPSKMTYWETEWLARLKLANKNFPHFSASAPKTVHISTR